ncbi:heparinase II/III family protein [Campylobacter iguaniorum]|uniref:Heparinase II/III family protein n=1 Tax=Campylobacter iguaniorum TaxID=1244531 RepID=A0A076F7E0_9BACT|nr:heparinase II/III family protein [Campylobacter iguaniorum]
MNKFIRLFNTVKFLKFSQIYYRLFYFVRNKIRKTTKFKYDLTKKSKPVRLNLIDSIGHYSKFENGKFDILNLPFKFDKNIDWNYDKFGKLWAYNLTYFEYLKDKNDLWLIYDFIDNIQNIKDGLEPFPISLRCINWIKFITKFDIKDQKINDSLYAQYYVLLDNIEYHLLGNHLLENGFSLLFGAYYFQDDRLYEKAKRILQNELDRQILLDGAHFELSPMYHQLMFFRLLDCINLVKNNSYKQDYKFENLLCLKASKMLTWLKNITYANGDIPLLGDSANKIAPTSAELYKYANSLNITPLNLKINRSGYYKINRPKYECVVDICDIKASYIPGHTHADTFSFELMIDGKPCIVDSGISTYDICDLRSYQRSTKAHNCVEINGLNSSEVWSSFRVANRAKVFSVVKKEDYIKATHNGYRKFGVLHTREWKFDDDKLIIADSLNKKCNAIFRLHFHPNITQEMINNMLNSKDYKMKFNTYDYASEFNKTQKALFVEIKFEQFLEVEINL